MLTFLRRAPLVVICIFFISGILLEFEFSLSPSIPPYLTFALLAIEFLLILKKRFLFLQTLIIISASFLLGISTTSSFLNNSYLLPQKQVQIDFQIEKKLRNNQYIGVTEENRFLVQLEKCDTLLPGNELTVIGNFKKIEPPKLPWLFNQKKQMLSNGITQQLVVTHQIKTTTSDEHSIRFLPQKIQRDLKKKITSTIPDSSAAAILSALLLG